MMGNSSRAFTLIELLVVITIIVVLLSLLTPSLDRAIYQAELVACGANQDAVASGATLYAMENKRRYPNRPGNRESEDTTSFAPFYLRSRTDNLATNGRDLRPVIRDYISAKMWNCPLAGDIDLSEQATKEDNGVKDVDRVYAGYNMFFGFQYTLRGEWLGAKIGERGMTKLGDRWSFTYNPGQPDERRVQFKTLTNDVDWQKWNGESFGSHPDETGTMSHFVSEGEQAPWVGDGTVTWNWYQKGDTGDGRGFIDMNYSASDGSVGRVNDVDAERYETHNMADVPLMDTRFGWDGEWLNVPMY